MSDYSYTVTSPLTVRLLRRILLISTLLLAVVALARGWWEYRDARHNAEATLESMERVMSAPLAGSLWAVDLEGIRVQLEGLRSAPAINYAAVLEQGRVVAESGVRKETHVLTRATPLVERRAGHSRLLGTLELQADLDLVRHTAFNAVLIALGFNSGMVLVVSLMIFLLTRGMISRHLSQTASHFQSLDPSPGEMHFKPLHLDKVWKGDELDILCLAVNNMQENLARIYAKAWLAEREARSQARFPEENPNPVLRATSEGVLVQANPASQEFMVSMGCTLGQRLPEAYEAILNNAFTSGQVQQFEAEVGAKTYAFVARPIAAEHCVNIYGMDITERKQAADAIRRSLHEKEILLKEVHHRVKNNMQVISSLLFLQMEYVSNPEDRVLFAESQKRIQAMALVHEELYGATDLASVGMREYVTRLVDRLLISSSIPVRSRIDVDELRLPVTRSIPCGLALNELVMNALKHAFTPARGKDFEGLLSIAMHDDGSNIHLTVEDNGPGLPTDFDIQSSPTLGMTLVAGLVQQLGGNLTAGNAPGGGARFSLLFPSDEAAVDRPA